MSFEMRPPVQLSATAKVSPPRSRAAPTASARSLLPASYLSRERTGSGLITPEDPSEGGGKNRPLWSTFHSNQIAIAPEVVRHGVDGQQDGHRKGDTYPGTMQVTPEGPETSVPAPGDGKHLQGVPE